MDEFGEETYSSRKVEALRGNVDATTGKRENVLVYIKRDVRYLVTRTSGDRNRPELSDRTPFGDIMQKRMPWYFDAADYVVDATGRYNETSATIMKSKFAIRDEVLEFFYLENGIAWPASDEGDREKATRRGETLKHTR